MASQLNDVYESLLQNKPISIQFPSQSDFDNFYSQLRTIKSRYDKKFMDAFSESLSKGRVIRYRKLDSTASSDSDTGIAVEFFLGTPVERSKIQFTIISTQESDSEVGK